MRRTKPQLIFLSCDHPQHSDATFRQIELCGGDLHAKHNFRSVLTDEHLKLLGETDEDWFENAAKEFSGVCEGSRKAVGSSTKQKQDENSIATLARSKDEAVRSHLCLQETPVRKDAQFSNISELDSSPPLFTPDQKGKTLHVTDAACHSTPSVTAESQTFSPLKSIAQDPNDYKVDSSVNLPSLGISPLGDGGPNPREDTPQVLRNLMHLQTPSTANKTQETLSMSALQQTLPTPQRLSKSLGAEVNDLNFSWTSSMATPFSARKTSERDLTCVRTTSSVARGTDSPQTWKPIIAKVLFAGCEKKVQTEAKSLEREESSETLQSLHFSSTEDEAEASDQEKDDVDAGKKDHHLKRKKKDGSFEIKRMKKVKEWKDTPLKVKMEGPFEEKRKMRKDLGCGGSSLMKGGYVDGKEDIKASDLEEGSSEKKKQKIKEDIDVGGKKEMQRVLELKMEKGEGATSDVQLEDLHEGRSGKKGDNDDCNLGKKMESVEVNDGKEKGHVQTEGNMKCDERRESIKTGEMEIQWEEKCGMEKYHSEEDVDKTEGERDGDTSKNELELSTSVDEKGGEKAELYHEDENGDEMGASVSNQMEEGCVQMIESKVNTEIEVRLQEIQQVQNGLDEKGADGIGHGTSSSAVTLHDGERDEELVEHQPSEVDLSKMFDNNPVTGGSIPKEKDKSETVTSKLNVKASCGEGGSNTTLTSSTQNWHVKQHAQDIPQSPHQNVQRDNTCVAKVEGDSAVSSIVEDNSSVAMRPSALEGGSDVPVMSPVPEGSVAVMSPSAEAGLYGRLAILAETLNIPLAQMIEADKKARKLQEAALRKATPPSNGTGMTYKPSQDIETPSGGNLSERKLQNETAERETTGREHSSCHEVSAFEAKNEKEEPEEKIIVKSAIQADTNSPPSLLLDGSQSNGSQKSLNIADTLAFFLATPPLMQKRKASLGQIPPAAASHGKTLSEKGDEMGVSKIEELPENDIKLSGSPPALTKKDAVSVTPPQVGSSPNACLFSPLTPSTTEALLRATDAVSSSLESSGESKDVEVNNNTCQGNEECNILEASPDHLEERSVENEAVLGENLLSIDQTLKSAEDSSIEEENSSMLAKDGEMKGHQEKGKKDLSPRNNSHEEIDEDGKKLDISQEDIDSPVSFLKVGKSLSARRFLYPMSNTKMNIKPKLLAWQQNAVLDELFLEEGDKETSDATKEHLSETGKKLENGASEKELLNRSKTGQFQTFNSFLQSELKEGDKLGCPLQKEKDGIDEPFTKQDLKRTAEEVTNLSSRTKELCDLNEGFLTDPPELIHNVRSPASGEGLGEGGGGDVVPLSHKMGPGGDLSFQSYLCVEDMEEERRCIEEVDEKKHQRSCEGERVSSVSGKPEKNGQSHKLSNDRSDNVSQNSGSRMDNNLGKTVADSAKDVPAAEESDMDNLLGDRTATLHTKANEMSSLTEQFASGDTVSVPDKQTNPPFVGFQSALGTKIHISASAIEKAKLFMQELELVEPAITQDKNVTNLSSGKVELESHDILSSKFDAIDGKFNQSEKAVFAGFTSGAGRPIQISAKALKDAELLLEKFESEDLENASSTEEQKSKISVDVGSGKSEDTCQESSDGNGFSHDNLGSTKTSASKIAARSVGGATNENPSLSKNLVMQGGFAKPAHRLSKKYDPSKNYNHLPKGFRPFKPPARRLVTGESSVGAVQKLNKYPEDSPQGECQKQNCEEKEIMQQRQKEDVGSVPLCNDRIKTKISEVDSEEFGEEENEAHIVREIAAAEEAEMLYDFMNDDDDIVDTQIDTLLTASTEEVKVLKQDEVTFDPRLQVKETGVKLGKVEKSQALLGVNRSNVCLSGDGLETELEPERKFVEGEKQSVTLLSHDQDVLRSVEQSKMSEISNDPVEVSNLAGNTPTTQKVLLDSDGSEVKGFVGFQTAKGNKIEISDEARVKAKQFLLEEDSEVSSDPLISSFPLRSENDKALKTSAPHEVEKSSPEVDKTFKPIQREKRKSILKTGEVSNPKKIKTSDMCTASSSVGTGNGKKVRFSEESLKSVQMALEAELRSENDSYGGCGFSEDEVRKRSFENVKETLNCGDGPRSSFTGFQTGNGKQVNISKEALDRARQTWCDEGLVADCETEGTVSNTVLPKHETTLSSCSPKFCSASAGYQSHKGNQSLNGPHVTQGHTSVTDMCNKESGGLVQTLNSDLLDNSLPHMKTGEGEHVDGKDGERNFSEFGSQKIDESRTEEKSRKLPVVLQSGPPGFQTASGVSIKISESALEKARKLWSEDDNVTEWIQGEKLKKHTEAISKDEDNDGCVLKGNPFTQHKIVSHATLGKTDQNSLEEGMFSGFQTASGSKVKVSASSLEKAKNLLSEDVDEETSTNPSKKCGDTQDRTNKGVEPTYIGFQTAKGTKVSISDAALEKAQKFLSEEGLASPKKQNSGLSTNDRFGRGVGRNLQGQMFSGFQTGRGSKVKISATALEKAKSLWSEDMDIDPPGKRRKLDNSLDKVNMQREPEIEETCNFQTAAGSKVKVSQEALEKARSDWSEDEINLQVVRKSQKSEENQTNPESLAFSAAVGFQTANGSKISVSSSALEKAKKFLEEDDSLLQCSHKKANQNFSTDPEKKHSKDFPIPQTKFSGFQTGNGAKVEISTAAMERAKQLWSDDVDFGQDKKIGTLLSSNQKSSQMISGFQTAKGSSVTVSHAALQKAQSLFAEEEDNRSCLDFKKNTKGEEVDRSNSVVKECQSLKSLKGMKEYYPGVKRSMVPSASGSQFGTVRGNAATSGFLTGRGKAVAISESSLREAKAKWDDQRDSGSLNMAEKFVSLPHEETVLKSGFGTTLKEQKTGESPSASSVNCDESVHYISGNTSKDSMLLQEERRCRMGDVSEQYKGGKPGLNMDIHPRSEDQFSLAWGQSASVAGSRAADIRGRMRHGHTSQFTSKVQKGSSPGNSPVTKLGSHHLPQRSSPASVLSDRTSPARPLVSSGPLSESVIREPPTNARIFKKRINMETSYNEKSHENVCLKQVWQQARMSQSKRIQDKKKTAIKPKPGYLSKHRKGKQRVSLRDAVDQTLPNHFSEKEILCAGVLPSTLNISAQSSSAYRFKAGDFFSHETLASPDGVLLGDGGRLVPSDDGTVGAEEFKNALFDTPGVDPALVSPDWVENHFRWIVWKLASMEVAYPTHFGGRLLTPDRVLLQLKHRYDREIDQSQRSVIKKILERDEAASRRMVLCVAGILEPQSPKEDDRSEKNDDKSVKDTNKSAKQNCHLLLTDGWYAVKTIIDTPLSAQVEYGKICIGTKLCLSGGELVGSQDACSPLEIPENLFFRISYNSTRRAKFDACLGIQKDPRPFPVPLKSVCGSGGTVGCVDIIIARVYPMQYMEKYPDGSSVFRSLRAEERAAAEFSKAKQRRMETLYSQIQKKYEEKKRKESQLKKVKRSCKFTQEEVNAMTTGEELYAALTLSLDSEFLESCLTQKQVTLLQDYQRSLQEKQNHDIQEELRNALSKQEAENSLERKVISLTKIRVADYYGRQKGNPPCTSMLTIWRPAEDLISQLTEGKRFQLTNLSASGARFQWNSSSAQLASTRSTRYLERQTQGDILDSIYHPREAASLQSLVSGCHQSMYGEVDVVGLVATVKGGSGGLQKVYLTDEHCHVVEVRLWNGLKSHHIEDVVRPGKFITASNLQVRGAETSVLHATELSLFSVNPKAKLLQHSLVELKNKIKDVTAILHLVEESIDQLMNRQIPQRPSVKVSSNNSTISSSGYSSASNSFVASPSGKEHQKRDDNDLGQGVTHQWVPYEGKVSPSPITPSSTPHTTQRSQFTKGTTQGNDGVSQFCRRNPVTPNQMLIANPSEDKVSAKKKDIQRRSSLLARIPSPPPLTPLPDCTTSELRNEFRTPVRGSTPTPVRGGTPSSVPMLSFDMTQMTSVEKKTMAVSGDSKLPSSTVREEPACALVLEENAEDGSIQDSLTATQAARLEVGRLTDVEIRELAGSWSQPLSYSSSDENSPETKEKPCERGSAEGLKGKDGELHVSVDVDECKSLEEKTVMKNDSCELKAGEENTVLDGSRNCRGQSAQIGGRSLSRKKRERVKQEAVDVTSVKRRKLGDDSCQMEFQSENYLDSLRLLSEKDCTLGAKDIGGLKSSKPERGRIVGVSENEINERTNDKNVGSSDHNSYDHASISGETAKSHKNLSGNIQNVSIEDIFHGDHQAKEKEDTRETVTENTESQTNVSSSVVQKGGRKGRKFRRSNVNLALLDETNLQVSPENDRLSSRLRRRSRPSYKE